MMRGDLRNTAQSPPCPRVLLAPPDAEGDRAAKDRHPPPRLDRGSSSPAEPSTDSRINGRATTESRAANYSVGGASLLHAVRILRTEETRRRDGSAYSALAPQRSIEATDRLTRKSTTLSEAAEQVERVGAAGDVGAQRGGRVASATVSRASTLSRALSTAPVGPPSCARRSRMRHVHERRPMFHEPDPPRLQLIRIGRRRRCCDEEKPWRFNDHRATGASAPPHRRLLPPAAAAPPLAQAGGRAPPLAVWMGPGRAERQRRQQPGGAADPTILADGLSARTALSGAARAWIQHNGGHNLASSRRRRVRRRRRSLTTCSRCERGARSTCPCLRLLATSAQAARAAAAGALAARGADRRRRQRARQDRLAGRTPRETAAPRRARATSRLGCSSCSTTA